MMPSNLIAQNSLDAEKVPHKVFPNLARGSLACCTGGDWGSCRDQRDPDLCANCEARDGIIAAVTETAKAELEAAGIKAIQWPTVLQGEVPSKVVGGLSGWHFERRWYYWSASGPGIPPDIAEKLHATCGQEVRVEGHCGCPSPLEWRKGFAIGSYHVDTQEGLNALADTLRSIYDASKDPDAQPYMGG